jgi:two-component system, cell cycle sensor histidine kinase and response regulator CckA
MPARDEARELVQRTDGDNAMYRAAFDTARNGVAIVALDGRFIEVNAAFSRIMGYSSVELQQLYFQSLTHPDDLETGLARRRALLAGEARAYELEKRYFHKSGRVLWVRVVVTLIRDQENAPLFFVCQLHDITDHKAQEERLLLREEALNSISQAIAIADAAKPDYPIIYVNTAFERITGYAPSEAIGRNCRFLQGAATDPAMVARMRADLHEGRPFHGEVVNHRKDGITFYNELAITPVRDSHGRLTHFIGILTDLTGRHSLEAQLRQALKIEAIGKLTAGVAHDFNNLLMVAHGNLELLGEALASGEPQFGEFLDQAQKAVERGTELTQRLLAFSRLQPQRAAAVDLNQLVTDLVPLLRRILGEDVVIETSLADGRLVAMVDRGQLENAVLNLAVNARDAMPQGGRLTIDTGKHFLGLEGLADLPAGEYLRIAVSDTGEGMASEVMERAFEPFFTTKEAGKGTGLGLSMVYGFVHQSGGHATLESEIGRGTKVALYLPPIEAVTATPAELRRRPVVAFGSESVLLVEDDAAVRTTVRLMLKDFGYRVAEASDGQNALDLLDQGLAVDLICTDLVMPGSINGWQLALEIWQRRPRQKILFTTGYTDNPTLQQMGQDFRIHILQKPFGRKDLAAAVRQILDDKPSADDGAVPDKSRLDVKDSEPA